jgi:hypothetical protein
MAQHTRDNTPRRAAEELDEDGLPRPDDATLAALRAEAKREPPSPDFWADLYASLVWAAELERCGARNAELPEGATTSEYALHAVIAFLQATPSLNRLAAIGPLLRLDTALVELADGRVSPMFKPVKKRGGSPGAGVPPVAIGLAARAMDELIRAGSGRSEAARQVAIALQTAGYRRVSAKTVANWRDGCNEGPGGRVPGDAVKSFRDPLPPGMGDTPARRAASLLERLKRARALLGT